MKLASLKGILLTIGLAVVAGPLLASDLFVSADSTDAAKASSETWVTRARNVAVAIDAVDGVQPADVLGLNLFADAVFDGRVEAVKVLGANRAIIRGVLKGVDGSQFMLARNQDVLVGTIRAGDLGVFYLRHTQGGHQVQAVDQSALPACATGHEHALSAPKQSLDLATVYDDGSVIDVMVVYTPNARISVGGTTAMQALIDLAVSETNTAYLESQISHRINLVHSYEVNYSSSGSFDIDLNRLTSNTDGYMDDVHPTRDQYSADLVSLFTNNGQYCGIAWVMTALTTGFEANGFNVVFHGCATGYYSFGHELSHNMGSAHDRANAGAALYPYSYGWRFLGSDGLEYRTVMAYAPGTRVDRFSNPNVAYQDTATGTVDDDNARSINDAALTVSNFRDSTGVQPQPLATYSTATKMLWVGNTQVIGGSNLETQFVRQGGSFILTYMGPPTTFDVGATYDPLTEVMVVPNGTIIETQESFSLELLRTGGSKFQITGYTITP
ncbi:MAG: M12 family metallo-peptidase [Pseudomonadota bacterium]|nr:M12 family metallo-peptidase [Pseudomonadota bacterium]